jgi:hypothetical protein
MGDLVLGIDFDNTLVSYDGVFHRVASDQGLITPDIGLGKDDVRKFLRAVDREDDYGAAGRGLWRAHAFGVSL